MISVIIPLYNKEMYIKETISKVLNQTYQNFEIVVVNDGSTDKSIDKLSEFNDHRISVVNKENGGVSSARNLGIKQARYDYVAFLDADDEWSENHLQALYDLIQEYKDRADVFVTNFSRKYGDKIVPNRQADELEKGIVKNYFKECLKKAVIHTSCVCVKKNRLHDVGMFDPRISRGEDIDVWNKLARKYNVVYSPQLTSFYVMEAENSCTFTLPEPEKIYAYYINLDDTVNKYDKKFNKDMLIKRTFRYAFLDFNYKGFWKIFKKQWRLYLK